MKKDLFKDYPTIFWLLGFVVIASFGAFAAAWWAETLPDLKERAEHYLLMALGVMVCAILIVAAVRIIRGSLEPTPPATLADTLSAAEIKIAVNAIFIAPLATLAAYVVVYLVAYLLPDYTPTVDLICFGIFYTTLIGIGSSALWQTFMWAFRKWIAPRFVGWVSSTWFMIVAAVLFFICLICWWGGSRPNFRNPGANTRHHDSYTNDHHSGSGSNNSNSGNSNSNDGRGWQDAGSSWNNSGSSSFSTNTGNSGNGNQSVSPTTLGGPEKLE